MARPLTGVGYYTLNLFSTFASEHPEFALRAFVSSARPNLDPLLELQKRCASFKSAPWPTRLKNRMWTKLEWPPLEWFTGKTDIVHGAFHLLPPSRRSPRLVTIFDLSNLRYPELHQEDSFHIHAPLLHHAVKRADSIIAISQSCKNDIVELLGVAPERVDVVYGGIDVSEFAKKADAEYLNSLRKRFGVRGEYFIHLGTLEPRKNLPRLIKAYASLKNSDRSRPQLVLAGQAGWMFEEIFETIERLNLGKDVIHTGYLSREDALSLLSGASACVYPSLYEGFGLPVLEAMAAGVPILTSNVSSMPEVAGNTGILVNPTDIDEIASGLTELIERPEDAARRAEAARSRAGQFTWSKSAATLAAIYRKALR
jgi:glycosyltransferase involved in cell wall biosynthesis